MAAFKLVVSLLNAEDAITTDIKEEGSSIYIIGKTYDELGGSQYYSLLNATGRNAPKVRAAEAKENMESLTKAMRSGLVRSCHDLSEGGLAVAAAEMAFSGSIGISIDAEKIPNEIDKSCKLLFSESNSRFLAEVRRKDEKQFEETATAARKIGITTAEKKLIISHRGSNVIDADLHELKSAWQGTIKW